MRRYLARQVLAFISSIGLTKPELIGRVQEVRSWVRRRYAPPSPSFVKRAVLARNGLSNCSWVESGTYLGRTTRVLARRSLQVISIEPDKALFDKAREKFKKTKNVVILNGLSEDLLPDILSGLSGNVCFWLDGHFSGGVTFKGPQDTPIREELALIVRYMSNLGKIVVFVDDLRMFESATRSSEYPPLNFLVNWANLNGFSWKIEHDIFVAIRALS